MSGIETDKRDLYSRTLCTSEVTYMCLVILSPPFHSTVIHMGGNLFETAEALLRTFTHLQGERQREIDQFRQTLQVENVFRSQCNPVLSEIPSINGHR